MPLPASNFIRKTLDPIGQPNIAGASNQTPKQTASQYPVSSTSVSKETELISEQKFLDEVRRNIETEIDQEVKEAGLQEIRGSVDLPQKVANETGVVEVGEEVKIPSQLTLKLPLNDEKIKTGLKEPDVTKAILWLANWCVRQFKIAKEKALGLLGVKS